MQLTWVMVQEHWDDSIVELLLLELDISSFWKHYYHVRMLIRYFDGSVRSAMLLAAVGTSLRAALPGCEDASEYRWAGGAEWRDQGGATVGIEFDAGGEAFEREWRHRAASRPVDAPCSWEIPDRQPSFSSVLNPLIQVN